MWEQQTVSDDEHRKRQAYLKTYRIFNFSCIGFVVLVFSVALSRSLGWVGFVLPSLFIAITYLVVTFGLDVLIFALELRSGAAELRPKRKRSQWR